VVGLPIADSCRCRLIRFLDSPIRDDENNDAEESSPWDEDVAKVIERKHLGNRWEFGETIWGIQGFAVRFSLLEGEWQGRIPHDRRSSLS
jgi:hypothetical protein